MPDVPVPGEDAVQHLDALAALTNHGRQRDALLARIARTGTIVAMRTRSLVEAPSGPGQGAAAAHHIWLCVPLGPAARRSAAELPSKPSPSVGSLLPHQPIAGSPPPTPTMTALPSADLAHAAVLFFPGGCALTALGASTGFSGSSFARLDADGRTWCLRRWPDGFALARLRFIHAVLTRSRTSGFTGVPALVTTVSGDTMVALDGALFDAQQWLAGQPLDGKVAASGPLPNTVQRVPPRLLADVAAALARFHRSTAGMEPTSEEDCWPLTRYLTEVVAVLHAGDPALAAMPGAAQGRIACRWAVLLPPAVALAATLLDAHRGSAQAVTTICHGDLWSRHIFVADGRFSGFLDFENLSFGSAANDLAQLLLHSNGWRDRAAVLRAYEQVRPLEAEERAALPSAALLALAGEGLWSLGRLAQGTMSAPESAAHRHNLRQLLPSLEALLSNTPGGSRAG